jgi:hypothetical protein
MRIENLKSEINADRKRVEATVVWEDSDKKPQELFYETAQDFGEDLYCDPHAFLIGAILPAIQKNEKRVFIDAPICPELRNGLKAVSAWFNKWFEKQDEISIEAASTVRYPGFQSPRAGSFLSGGVDSLSILKANRLDFPMDHPSAIKDCLFVHGFDIGGIPKSGPELASYELALKSLSAIVKDANVTLIPVYTNVRHLMDDVRFWIHRFHGAALASVAHIFSRRLSKVSIASTFSIANIDHFGSHPLIDPNYSSSNLQIRHEGPTYSRLEKVKLIAEWSVALENLRVCTMNPSGRLNCGKCEKCIRTMLELLALGKLDESNAFPYQDVRPEMIEDINLTGDYQDAWYGDLVPLLTDRGRFDLVEIIQTKRQEFRKRLAWEEERDWKGAIKRFDRRWLGGTLYKTYGTIRSVGVSSEQFPKKDFPKDL